MKKQEKRPKPLTLSEQRRIRGMYPDDPKTAGMAVAKRLDEIKKWDEEHGNKKA